MRCEVCGQKFDEEESGITLADRYTDEQHHFCCMFCLRIWTKVVKA